MFTQTSKSCLLALALAIPMVASAINNPGFEDGMQGWKASTRDTITVKNSSEGAPGSSSALQIMDPDAVKGAFIASDRFQVDSGAKYQLLYQGKTVSGNGCGVYVVFFDASKKAINRPGNSKGTDPVGKGLSVAGNKWKSYKLDFDVPANATSAAIYILSYGKSTGEFLLDNFELKKM
ncbi:carbohydrate binding domain-containing protein [Ruficoccus sp. ZRK36]|uniref:carbohydrate binding domain-containing protein n=1 Tax=Ruficoccus sp. ZRK36 TaxID=2866311 RepID=UPI001C72A71E|nr:carbohydrate binding domain-containing protein [Ruficoccus sp. ZRK36]QYY36050.1 carbohydrate binding domain-containing protein [Ruficoccus sp. ZRK36]